MGSDAKAAPNPDGIRGRSSFGPCQALTASVRTGAGFAGRRQRPCIVARPDHPGGISRPPARAAAQPCRSSAACRAAVGRHGGSSRLSREPARAPRIERRWRRRARSPSPHVHSDGRGSGGGASRGDRDLSRASESTPRLGRSIGAAGSGIRPTLEAQSSDRRVSGRPRLVDRQRRGRSGLLWGCAGADALRSLGAALSRAAASPDRPDLPGRATGPTGDPPR